MKKPARNAVEIKIAYIGGWAHRLINDLTLCEHLTGHVVSCQELIVEAALARDKHLAFQALLNDPLTALPTDTAWKMFTQMLRATRASLPGWKI